jgi:hypothetical protein
LFIYVMGHLIFCTPHPFLPPQSGGKGRTN